MQAIKEFGKRKDGENDEKQFFWKRTTSICNAKAVGTICDAFHPAYITN